jgi:transposase
MHGNSKLTPELAEKICNVLRAGNYVDTAAAYAGICKDTYYDWLRRGARAAKANDTSEAEAPYRAFHAAVEQALAAAEIRDVALIGKAANDQWQAAAWRLERRYPEKWGRRERHEHSGPEGKPIQAEVVAQVVVLPELDASDSDEARGDLEAESGPTDATARDPSE